MSLRQKAIKGVFWSAIQSWGGQAVAFLVFALLARLLEPKAFGLISLATVFWAFVEVFLDQGFPLALIQRQTIEPEHLDTAFWSNLAVGILMTGGTIASADFVATLFNEPELSSIIRWLSCSFILRAFCTIQDAILRRNMAFKALATRSLIGVVIGGIIGVIMAFMGFGVWSLVGKKLSSILVQIFVLWTASDWRPGWKISGRHFQDLFSFGVNIIGINLFNFFNRHSDNFLIGYFLGSVALGYYTIGYRVLTVMTQLLTVITNQVAISAFSRLQQDKNKLSNTYFSATKLICFISFPAFIGVTLLAPELVPTLFGKQWTSSIPVVQILMLSGVFYCLEYLTSALIVALGKPNWKLTLNFANALTNVIGFLIAVKWGIVAVAIAYTIRGYIFLPVYLLAADKLIQIKFKQYLPLFLSCLASSLIMVISIEVVKLLFSNFQGSWLLAIYILVGMASYALIGQFLSPDIWQQMLSISKSLNPIKIKK